jgi:hypothetical protein
MIPTISLIVTTLVGLFVAYIAFQQWLTNRNQLRLALFDRRWKVYDAARNCVTIVALKRNVTDEELVEITGDLTGARFLFNQKIQDWSGKRTATRPLW